MTRTLPEPVLADAEARVGRSGCCETWAQLRTHGVSRRELRELVRAGRVGRIGDRYFPARWLTPPAGSGQREAAR